MTDLDLDALERLAREAKAAIGSPWEAGPYNSDVWAPSEKGGQTKIVDIRGWGYFTGRGSGALALSDNEATGRRSAICQHIAALSPDVCLALIERVRKAEDRCAIYKEQVETGGKVIDELRAQVQRMREAAKPFIYWRGQH